MASVEIITSGSGYCKGMGSLANEIIVPVDAKLTRKSGQKRTSGWESDKHSTCHSE